MNPILVAILTMIESGQLEIATNLVQQMGADPSDCNIETLAALQKARNLAIIQRSHIERQLRSLAASRLYEPSGRAEASSWQIDA